MIDVKAFISTYFPEIVAEEELNGGDAVDRLSELWFDATRWPSPLQFRIHNRISGKDLGVWEAGSAEEALNLMAQDAGYDDHAECEYYIPHRDGDKNALVAERAEVTIDEAMMGSEWGVDDDLRLFGEKLAEVSGFVVLQATSLNGGNTEDVCEAAWDRALELYRQEQDKRNASKKVNSLLDNLQELTGYNEIFGDVAVYRQLKQQVLDLLGYACTEDVLEYIEQHLEPEID